MQPLASEFRSLVLVLEVLLVFSKSCPCGLLVSLCPRRPCGCSFRTLRTPQHLQNPPPKSSNKAIFAQPVDTPPCSVASPPLRASPTGEHQDTGLMPMRFEQNKQYYASSSLLALENSSVLAIPSLPTSLDPQLDDSPSMISTLCLR